MSTIDNVSTRPLLVEVEGLYSGYDGPQGRVSVLTGVSMEVRRSEFVAIVGPSGSGKSSLLYLLGGMERASQGRISVEGCDLGSMCDREIESYRQYKVSFVFQFFNLLSSLTAMENVLLGMEAMGVSDEDAAERAHRALVSVGLQGKVDRYPAQLSGGEQQRVAIARALAKRTPLILADEPTGNLDETTAQGVMKVLHDVQREYQTTVILITHDQSIARQADRVLELRNGFLKEILANENAGNARGGENASA